MRQFGSVTVGRVRNSDQLMKFLEGKLPKSETYIVKPNWYSPHSANFTDANVLGMLLESLDGKVIITEGHTLDRQDGSMEFTVDGEKTDWKWLMEHPEWDWIKEQGRWDELRRQDKWFLDEHGFTDLFNEYDVEYINVTEEIWQSRIVDPSIIKSEVENQFSPLLREKIYGFMPTSLYKHRGSPLISLGKVKGYGGTYPSLTLKNMFGLIPDPTRSWWHGPKDRDLDRSIVDITKLYAAIFQLHGVCEAINTITISDPKGDVKAPWGNYRVERSLGTVAQGPNLVTLDAILCAMISVDPEKVGYLQQGVKEFGAYDRNLVKEAEKSANEWFLIKKN